MKIQLPEYAGDLFKPSRYKVFWGGRGGGKSWAFATVLLTIGMNKPIRVLCARELQVSIQDSVHKLLSDLINSHEGFSAFYEVQNKNIYGKNGTEFSFKGLKHNASEIKSYEGVDYCWIEEAQAVSDKSWEVLIPTIRKENSEIWISLNPKNPTDPTWVRFINQQDDDTLVRKVGWQDNPFFPDVLNKERLRLFKNDPSAYAHIWDGEFDTRYSGAVYAKWVSKIHEQGRISDKVKYDPDYPVYTAWDLGYDDATAIWFYQVGGGEVFIIDYYESNQEDIKHYCEILYGKEIVVEERDLETGEVSKWHFGETLKYHAHRQAYRYLSHYVPHDAAYKLQAAGGRSIMSQAGRLGIKMFSLPATTQQNSIEALRQTIPKCWISADRCRDGVAALMHYHFEYDEDRKVFKSSPIHDWSSHSCFVGGTKVLTRSGTYQMMDLPQTGEVLTLCGWKHYHSPRITRRNAPLVEVVFSDMTTVKCTPEHLFLTESGWKSAESLTRGTPIRSTLTPSPNISMVAYTECGRLKNIFLAGVEDYTEKLGAWPLVIFLKDAIFTIKTAIRWIIDFLILSVCPVQNTCLELGMKLNIKEKAWGFQSEPEKRPPHGIGQKREDCGIGGTMKRAKSAGYGSVSKRSVLNVWRYLSLLIGKVIKTKKGFVRTFVKPLTIESVKPLQETSDVWCLTVPDASCFSLENGAVVHNCDAAEILARAWTERTTTTKEMDHRAITNKFHRLRQEHNITQEDPYRTRRK